MSARSRFKGIDNLLPIPARGVAHFARFKLAYFRCFRSVRTRLPAMIRCRTPSIDHRPSEKRRGIAYRQGIELADKLQAFGVSQPESLAITEASELIDELKGKRFATARETADDCRHCIHAQ